MLRDNQCTQQLELGQRVHLFSLLQDFSQPATNAKKYIHRPDKMFDQISKITREIILNGLAYNPSWFKLQEETRELKTAEEVIESVKQLLTPEQCTDSDISTSKLTGGKHNKIKLHTISCDNGRKKIQFVSRISKNKIDWWGDVGAKVHIAPRQRYRTTAHLLREIQLSRDIWKDLSDLGIGPAVYAFEFIDCGHGMISTMICMEAFDMDLRKYLSQDGPFDRGILTQISDKTDSLLQQLVELRVSFLDIKPDNIVIRIRNGHVDVRIIDLDSDFFLNLKDISIDDLHYFKMLMKAQIAIYCLTYTNINPFGESLRDVPQSAIDRMVELSKIEQKLPIFEDDDGGNDDFDDFYDEPGIWSHEKLLENYTRFPKSKCLMDPKDPVRFVFPIVAEESLDEHLETCQKIKELVKKVDNYVEQVSKAPANYNADELNQLYENALQLQNTKNAQYRTIIHPKLDWFKHIRAQCKKVHDMVDAKEKGIKRQRI